MKEETLDKILYELEQAENIGTAEEIERGISYSLGGCTTLLCC